MFKMLVNDVIEDRREIDKIEFGIFSTKDILKMSVAEISSSKLTEGKGTVYDERMGVLVNDKICETCNQNNELCPGHFGHIVLEQMIINPMFYKKVNTTLHYFCIKCYRLLLTEELIKLKSLSKMRVRKELSDRKVEECTHCKTPQPNFKFVSVENIIHMVYKDKKKKISVEISTDEIKKIFDNILDEDLELIGINPKHSHPKNFIMEVFPVLPPVSRPFVITGDGNICDDDLTNQLVEIIKCNNNLKKKDTSEIKKAKFVQSLKFRISTFMNNSQGKAKHTTSGRAIKGLKERLTGKTGQIRSNLMGKRCLGENVPVLLWNGKTKLAKDIEIGDILVGDDGNKRVVQNITSGESEMFKVIQNKGIDYDINDHHILTLKLCLSNKIYWDNNKSKCGSWCINWFDKDIYKFRKKSIAVSKTKTKEEAFKQMLNFIDKNIDNDKIVDIPINKYIKIDEKTKRLLLGVKLNTPIKWNHKNIKLDPYILGMWLGDGTSRGYSFTSIDKELIEYYKKWATKNNCKISVHKSGIHFGIIKDNTNFNNFQTCLKYYNLINNKHIPDDYIYNDISIRLSVLAGLIDTDGHVSNNGTTIRLTQCEKNYKIIEGVKTIAESLGFCVSINDRNIKGKIYKRITISGNNLSEIPTLLHRKECKNSNKDVRCYKIEVKPIGLGKYYGFEVDGNSRFLLGDYTITHNCDYTGRTVIGPDPTLKMGELGIPREVASNLTVPVRVNSINIESINTLVNTGKANYVIRNGGKTKINLKYALQTKGTKLLYGDVIVRKGNKIKVENNKQKLIKGDILLRNEEEVKDLSFPEKKIFNLKIGDVVHRKLKDGDIVLLNRQPTLWQGSMMAQRVKIMPHKTFRINLAITSSFNADFNIGVKQGA